MNVEQIIKNPPEKYEAFLYRFTNLENSKKYIGIHKGFVGDGYLHSSTNEEFIRDLSNDSIKFKYEILNYGDYKTMTVLEYNKLTGVQPIKSDNYFAWGEESAEYAELTGFSKEKIRIVGNMNLDRKFNKNEDERKKVHHNYPGFKEGFDLDTLKIDVEGYEYKVLKGAKETIKKLKIVFGELKKLIYLKIYLIGISWIIMNITLFLSFKLSNPFSFS